MDTVGWVIVIVLAVLVVAGILALAVRNRRSARLKRRFGSEYDRAVGGADSRKDAEQRLEALSERRDTLDIRPLDPESRARYAERWEVVQTRFVDEPEQAVNDADEMITEVLRERGYPVEDFDERTSLVATDHPDVVGHYRAAHEIHLGQREAPAPDTEALREAFVHYRALFSALVQEEGDVRRTHSHEREQEQEDAR